MTFAVRIFGGIKAAFGMRHVAQNVIENIACNVCVTHIAADEKCVEIQLSELRIVVEHFLEMWHKPFGIDRITRKAAAELVVNAARGHSFTRLQHHANGFLVAEAFGVAKQELRLRRLRKFRRAA